MKAEKRPEASWLPLRKGKLELKGLAFPARATKTRRAALFCDN
jgi:hypothetical protein